MEGIVFKVVRGGKQGKKKKRIREEMFASQRVFSEILRLVPIWLKNKRLA